MERGDAEALVDCRSASPDGARAHPRDEHYLPLLVACGAGGGRPGITLHRGFSHGMAAFSFG